MRIAVIGATGTAGRPTVAAARAAGHDVRELSRATGVDLHTGAGLRDALTGADAAIDASNAFPAADADVVEAFATATGHVIESCRAAGVGRLVHLSICNIDDPGFDAFPYYVAKRAQERALSASDIPHTVVRSGQWMEFATNPAAVRFHADHVDVEDWLIQPVAVATVAGVLVDAATSPEDTSAAPGSGIDHRAVAGPETIRLPELTRALLAVRRDARSVVTVPASLPAFADGTLLAPATAELLGPTPAEWLAAQEQ